MEKTFGRGFTANRNGKYSLKEWDFTDSNFDKFLIYDYKGTTNFWGENMDLQEYEVILFNFRDSRQPNQKDFGWNLTQAQKNSGQNLNGRMNLQLTVQSMQNGENSELGSLRK